MITVHLMGGLGNQLFQWALGCALSRHDEVQWDRSIIDRDPARTYLLDQLGLRLNFGTSQAPRVQERSLRFDPAILGLRGDVQLIGYWQSERYFTHVPSLPGALFANGFSVSEETERIADRIHRYDGRSVFLHVRRTDYTRLAHYYRLLDAGYYHRAMGRFRERLSAPHFFIFSDDPAWCHEALRGEDRTVVDCNPMSGSCDAQGRIRRGRAGREVEDLWLMSLCQNGILANSTFSWWGAWLGERRHGGDYLAPDRWFTEPSLDATDIVPDRWQRADDAPEGLDAYEREFERLAAQASGDDRRGRPGRPAIISTVKGHPGRLTPEAAAAQRELQALSEHPHLPSQHRYNISICDSHRFIWFRVAKVGTRTILHHLLGHVTLDAEESSYIRYPINGYKDYLKFAFVRNPWSRLVSAWRDKVVRSNYFLFSPSELARMQSFKNFISFVEGVDVNTCDRHLQLQSRLIDLNNLDVLGRLETFARDLNHVLSRLGLPPYLDGAAARKNTSDAADFRSCYDADTRRAVAKIYERDIDIFGYTFDS